MASPLTRRARLLVWTAVPVYIVAAYGAAVGAYTRLTQPTEVVATHVPVPPDGGRLYLAHCAHCHGEQGTGVGPAGLDPRARWFGGDKFKFASTDTGVPTDDDLLRVLEHGIAGSPMHAFGYLTDAQRRAVVDHLRVLALRGTYDRLAQKVEKDGDDVIPHELRARAADLCVPGKPIPVPPPTPNTPDAVARGKALYVTSCAQCHGPDGKGDGPQVKDLRNENGTPAVPRNLTAGQYKGGGEAERLYVRLRLGVPGTPMPASPALTDAQVYDLVWYVKSLAEPPALAADGSEPRSGGSP